MHTLTGTRFGSISFADAERLTFDIGPLGFENFTEYVLFQSKAGSAFRWLQSLQEPGLAFLLVDPANYLEYCPEVSDAVMHALKADDVDGLRVYTTASVPSGDATQMTINLAAPIIINWQTQKAIQAVLDNPAYTVRYSVFHNAGSGEAKAA
jgi:flagellar assembly factor FliW